MGKNNSRSNNWKKNGNSKGGTKNSIAPTTVQANVGRCQFPANQLMQDVATIRFNTPAGDRFPNVSGGNVVTPSILALSFMPTPGITTDYLSPINLSARRLYAQVRKANSGKVNYESEDLMMCCYALSSIFTYHAWGVRAYATLQNYSRNNRAIPKGLVQAMGFDYDDLVENMAEFRAYLNLFSSKVSAAVVPKDIPYFSRHIWMVSNLFKDADSDKATIYLYKPAGFFKYVEMYNNLNDYTGCKLEWYTPAPLMVDGVRLSDYIEIGDELLDQLIRSYDIDIMAGDLIRAYGDSNMFTIGQISEDVNVEPTYDISELAVIQNATIHSMPLANTCSITQDPLNQTLLFNPEFNAPALPHLIEQERLINVYNVDAPSPDEIIRITRFTTTCTVASGSNPDTYFLDDCGSEVIVGMKLYYMNVDEDGNRKPTLSYYTFTSNMCYDIGSTSDNSSFRHILDAMAMLSRCDFHPYINVVRYSTSSDGTTRGLQSQHLFGDICNAAVLDSETLHMIHESVLLAQFDVPTASR